MANKTVSNLKSQEQSIKHAIQSQVARIKKEEEEELWISGEELYTEGSSDEEEYKTQSRTHCKVNSNQSSRFSSANPSVERRGHSPVFTEIKAKSNHSIDVFNASITENQSVLKNVPKSEKTCSSENLTRSTSMETQTTQHSEGIPLAESSTSSLTKDFSDLSVEKDQAESKKISWKAKRELPYSDLEESEDENNSEINISSIDTENEWLKKEILKVQDLDDLIHEMTDKLKKANEETLFCQCENRKQLEKILTSSPSETGRLAENTRQFFYLCPRYTMLNAEFHDNKSYISCKTNDYKQQVFENEDNVNLTNFNSGLNNTEKDEWKVHYVKNVNDKILDSDSDNNPYIMDTETKKILLEMEEKIYQKSYDQGKLVEAHNTIPNTSITISTQSNVLAIKDINEDLVDEMIKEDKITDLSPLLKITED